ncbi:DUF4145 domain-containing protein [Stenotrophomonas maltophilia]|uniref:DUF4145 domain-containing protein n=1 Tax=Stenotrophomonas maltophilia TaxID=40324 RepID=UPI0009B2B03A|nr:DUF4145 domain-containing protein [Stenotrophomonas maltophilia]
MAVTYVGNCPHCYGEKMGMTWLATSQARAKAPTAVFSCNGCSELVCLTLRTGSTVHQWISHGVGNISTEAQRNNAVIARVYPKQQRVQVPDHIPDTVRRAYEQGADNANRKQSDAAAAMFRKALDVATKALDPDLAGKNLAPRIDALNKAGKLTNDLTEWAHAIRLDGNHGAHDDDELTEEDIAQLSSFTELFLTYTFTLPARVAARKAAAEERKKEGAQAASEKS